MMRELRKCMKGTYEHMNAYVTDACVSVCACIDSHLYIYIYIYIYASTLASMQMSSEQPFHMSKVRVYLLLSTLVILYTRHSMEQQGTVKSAFAQAHTLIR
jgi:hypothetical protein